MEIIYYNENELLMKSLWHNAMNSDVSDLIDYTEKIINNEKYKIEDVKLTEYDITLLLEHIRYLEMKLDYFINSK